MMNELAGLAWLSVVLFLIHEFEEIILIKAWSVRYSEKIATLWPKVKPFGLHLFDGNAYAAAPITETASIGIGMQFALIALLTLVSVLTGYYLVWIGFLALMPLMSIFMHTRDAIRFKGYTPGVLTAVLTGIPTLYIVFRALVLTDYGVWAVLVSVVGVNLVFGFFAMRFMHRTATALSMRLQRYAQGKRG
jgi:hypothetical protein